MQCRGKEKRARDFRFCLYGSVLAVPSGICRRYRSAKRGCLITLRQPLFLWMDDCTEPVQSIPACHRLNPAFYGGRSGNGSPICNMFWPLLNPAS